MKVVLEHKDVKEQYTAQTEAQAEVLKSSGWKPVPKSKINEQGGA